MPSPAGQHWHGLFIHFAESAVDHFGIRIIFTLGLHRATRNSIGQHVQVAGVGPAPRNFHQILQDALLDRSGDAIKQQLFSGWKRSAAIWLYR